MRTTSISLRLEGGQSLRRRQDDRGLVGWSANGGVAVWSRESVAVPEIGVISRRAAVAVLNGAIPRRTVHPILLIVI